MQIKMQFTVQDRIFLRALVAGCGPIIMNRHGGVRRGRGGSLILRGSISPRGRG
jgi:hypothetical protein